MILIRQLELVPSQSPGANSNGRYPNTSGQWPIVCLPLSAGPSAHQRLMQLGAKGQLEVSTPTLINNFAFD